MEGKLKCVAVDDDPLMLAILGSFINRTDDIEIVGEYHNYFDAATNITRLKPDIIFLDINMPGLNGLEMLDVLEGDSKVIIVSADTRPKEEFMVNDAIVDFLEKPLFYENFKTTILKTMELMGQSKVTSGR